MQDMNCLQERPSIGCNASLAGIAPTEVPNERLDKGESETDNEEVTVVLIATLRRNRAALTLSH